MNNKYKMNYKTHILKIVEHYENNWESIGKVKRWTQGPTHKVSPDFYILEFGPTLTRDMWTYSTVGMSITEHSRSIELHFFSRIKNDRCVELLTAIAYYHQNNSPLDLGHTVNFGTNLIQHSTCNWGLISLPYLDGPELEDLEAEEGNVKFYWLIPITKSELDFKKKYGMDELEEMFEKNHFDYLDLERKGIV